MQRRLTAAITIALQQRPTVPWRADYQRRPIGGPDVCQDSGRYWSPWHSQPPRSPLRPWHGPLTAAWKQGERVPRWYVWWRLFGEQDGHCATCPGPAEVVDHCHATGLVRGLLCYDCNHVEALHARASKLGSHRGSRCWFQPYWDHPPGGAFGWYWPHENRSTSTHFLTSPPTWATNRRVVLSCRKDCSMVARGLFSDGVLLGSRGC
ncbi:endonuclease domain-containing protein [Streptomyces mirabilis]